jgi:predicted O-linked N-acetylglucosamine transferase (SPINDLY family)
MTAALSNSPETPRKSAIDAACERAMELQIAGKLHLAEPIYRSVLESQPTHAGAHYCLGMLLVQQRRPADGSPHLLAAVNSEPRVADYWLGYLEALLLLGENAKASEILSIARQRGLSGDAVEDFARRLEAAGSAPATLAAAAAPTAAAAPAAAPTLEVAASSSTAPRKMSAAARRRREQAIQRQENAVMALVNQGLFREALPLARQMTERFPECGVGWKMLGAMLWSIGNEVEAIDAMQTSVRLLPKDAEAHKNLAAAVNKRQRLDDAEIHLRRALQIDPSYAPAHLVLGHNYQLQGRYAEARRSLESAIAAQARDNSAGLDPARSLLLFVLNNDPSVDADTMFAEHCAVGAYLERTERAAMPARAPSRSAHDRNPERRLNVGLVSADLYNHSVGYFIEPLLAEWQRSETVRTTVYYVNKIEDAVSQRLRGYVSAWSPVSDLSSAQLEQRILDDGIDILIDLSGHTALHRLATFARKPAPVQASWLGYPNTTGLSTVDYYLADKHFLPPGEFERYFTEKLVYLPAAWTFNPSSRAPEVNQLPALAAGHVTFGSFNRIAKISEPTVRLWSRLLRAVPGSQLLIAGVPLDTAQRRLIPWFAEEGIPQERLGFHTYSGQEHHFALHHRVDIGLEPMPYSGCTTSNHALWMGVPSLTCVGPTPASRLTAANLGQLGLEDFIAKDPDEFIAKGVRWANDLSALANLRAGLRARWQAAPARDAGFFAAGMELALRRMWQRWCAGLPAESFEITAEQAASKAAR